MNLAPVPVDLREADLGVEATAHWYYRSKARLVRMLLADDTRDGGHLIDVGAGSGFFSEYLLANTSLGSAECIDPNYPRLKAARVAGKEVLFRREPTGVAPRIILMMDVIEHVDDPVALLRRYARAAEPSTAVLVTVPAYDWLWSGHDEFLGHRRRYTRRLLTEQLEQAGFSVDRCGYFFLSLLPVVAMVRLLRNRSDGPARSDMTRAPTLLGAILEAVLGRELRWVGLNRLSGVSVVATARVADPRAMRG